MSCPPWEEFHSIFVAISQPGKICYACKGESLENAASRHVDDPILRLGCNTRYSSAQYPAVWLKKLPNSQAVYIVCILS